MLSGYFWLAAGGALIGSFQMGFQLAIMNCSMAAVAQSLHRPEAAAGALIVSCLLLGACVGALFAGRCADAFGPRTMLMVINVFLISGAILSAAAQGYSELLVGRFLCGLQVGAVSLLVPRFLTEIAPRRVRGSVGSLSQVLICTGILVAFIIGLPYASEDLYSVHILHSKVGWWRVMLATAVLPALCQVLCLLTISESPTWLRLSGRPDDARVAECTLLSGDDLDVALLEDVEEPSNLETQPQDSGAWIDLLKPDYRWVVCLSASLVMMQQLSGINALIYYSTAVFGAAGLSSPVVGTVLLAVVNLLGSILASSCSDRIGRRPLMITSHIGMAVSLLVTAAAACAPGDRCAIVSVSAMFIFTAFFSCGSGPLPFVIMSEMVGGFHIKAKVASVCTALNWSLNLLVGLSFPSLLSQFGIGGAFLLYALLNVVGGLICIFAMVETRKKSLGAIRRLLTPTNSRIDIQRR